MTSDPKIHAEPNPAPENQGFDRDYEAVRQVAERELIKAMAGPRKPLQQVSGDDIKNPEGEFAIPAPATGLHGHQHPGPGPNQAGNSSGKGPIDPQGQQGGTEGGQAGSPSLNLPNRTEGTPLANGEERERQSTT